MATAAAFVLVVAANLISVVAEAGAGPNLLQRLDVRGRVGATPPQLATNMHSRRAHKAEDPGTVFAPAASQRYRGALRVGYSRSKERSGEDDERRRYRNSGIVGDALAPKVKTHSGGKHAEEAHNLRWRA
jgi:hypothetical protein